MFHCTHSGKGLKYTSLERGPCLSGSFCFLSSVVGKIHVSDVMCIILGSKQAIKHATLQYKLVFY